MIVLFPVLEPLLGVECLSGIEAFFSLHISLGFLLFFSVALLLLQTSYPLLPVAELPF